MFKREITYGMNEINYIKYTLRRQSFIKSVSEILKTKAFSLIKLNDMKPVLAKIVAFYFCGQEGCFTPHTWKYKQLAENHICYAVITFLYNSEERRIAA